MQSKHEILEKSYDFIKTIVKFFALIPPASVAAGVANIFIEPVYKQIKNSGLFADDVVDQYRNMISEATKKTFLEMQTFSSVRTRNLVLRANPELNGIVNASSGTCSFDEVTVGKIVNALTRPSNLESEFFTRKEFVDIANEFITRLVENLDGTPLADKINRDRANAIKVHLSEHDKRISSLETKVDNIQGDLENIKSNTDIPSNETKATSNSKKEIWEASKADYLASRGEGSRFANLNILSGLLPHGYVIHTDFTEYGKTENGEIKPLRTIMDDYAAENITVIGEGGIGKTTFLLKTMEDVFSLDYCDRTAIPIFVELNRCPSQIGAWESAKHGKTNFITRYVASQICDCEYDNIPSELLTFVESELKKRNKTPDYIFLLDGFNEVNRGAAVGKDGMPVGASIREKLNNEIKILMNYPNVRIIMTSRKMDKAFLPGTTRSVELTGVKKADIEAHLCENNYTQWDINHIVASRKLMDCLRIPLFLCMFTAQGAHGGTDATDSLRPLTRGEILYHFFNRSHGIYSERLNAERLNIASGFDKTQTLFILDFVLPYIGWTLEYTDFFSVERNELYKMIEDFFTSDEEEISFWNKNIVAFPDYESETVTLCDIKDAIISKPNGYKMVVDCIVNTLCAMYRDKDFQYSFIHHHVRDYFAGIYEIQRMRMSEKFLDRYLCDKLNEQIKNSFDALSLMNANVWNETKRVFIGEILCEHRNAPEPNDTGKWALPRSICREQELLRNVLRVFRHAKMPVYCGVLNVVETMKTVRGTLAGEDFSYLSMVECRLHGVNCGVGRGENALGAIFRDTKLSDDVFETEGHTEEITYFAYSKHSDYLFTMADDNTVKRWETDTGHCVNTIKIECCDMVESDQLTQTHLAVSNDGEAFLTCGFNPLKDGSGHLCFIQQYDWKHRRVVYEPDGDFHDINTMSYSVDDKFVAVVFSRKNLRIYERDNPAPIFSAELEEVGNIIDVLILKTGLVLLFYTEGNWWWYEQGDYKKENDVEGIVYKIAVFDTKANTLEVLHEYSGVVESDEDEVVGRAFSPLYAVDSNGETVMFFEKDGLKKLTIQSKTITDMPFSYEEPNHITFAQNTNALFMLYYDVCVRYDVAEGCEIGMYRFDELDFQIKGKQSAIRLLMFDEELNTYERNLVTDSLTAKYQRSKHTIMDVFSDSTSKELIVTFDNDSLWVIDEESGKLVESLCYGEPDAKSCLSLYSENSGRMIFLFENENYEYIKCYNMKTGKSERAYFDFVEKNKIKSIILPEADEHLFCVFERSVSEINLTTFEFTEVFRAENDSIIQAAHYCDAENNVRIVTSYPLLANSPERKPRLYEIGMCENGACKHISWYELPYLEEKTLCQLSSFYQELFTPMKPVGDKFKKNHDFFISSGVFLNYNEASGRDIANALCVEKYFHESNGVVCIEKATLNPHEVNYVIGELPAILTQTTYDDSDDSDDGPAPFKLLDVSADGKTIVALLKDGLIVFLLYDGEFREVCRFSSAFEDVIGERNVTGARIGKDGFVYFWVGANKLYRLDTLQGGNKSYESFTPGLSVMGCDFSDADMSTVTRYMLVLHGGEAG